jgi:ferric-dicitrate binding protein FerR (iron transport regulator)
VPTSPDAQLLQRLRAGNLSPADIDTLISWLSEKELSPETKEMLLQQLHHPVSNAGIDPRLRSMLEAKLPAILAKRRRVIDIAWVRYASAAAVLLLVTAGVFLLNNKQKPKSSIAGTAPALPDIAPGKQGAILTLADGSTVVLDSLGNGLVATQHGAKVLLHDGRLDYHPDAPGNAAAPANPAASASLAYNTMTTPKGRQFQLTLPDGTKVWLDAASSIRYPTEFTGGSRRVELTGEAYFEVAPQNGGAAPFIVDVSHSSQVQVLGTHFNINAYADEPATSTTLLEGAVRIVNGDQNAILKPGQQSRTITGNNAIMVIPNADTEKAMAWKNGVFDFQDATLEQVMRQLQRWYDIDVVYEKGIPKLEFVGTMGRDLSLNAVLNGLEMSKVHFRLEAGKRLIVLP